MKLGAVGTGYSPNYLEGCDKIAWVQEFQDQPRQHSEIPSQKEREKIPFCAVSSRGKPLHSQAGGKFLAATSILVLEFAVMATKFLFGSTLLVTMIFSVVSLLGHCALYWYWRMGKRNESSKRHKKVHIQGKLESEQHINVLISYFLEGLDLQPLNFQWVVQEGYWESLCSRMLLKGIWVKGWVGPAGLSSQRKKCHFADLLFYSRAKVPSMQKEDLESEFGRLFPVPLLGNLRLLLVLNLHICILKMNTNEKQ